jgi:hypothetical protein
MAMGIREQAICYLGMMASPEELVRVYLPTESASPPLRLYMSAWDHNGEGRPKKLEKPDKMHALPEIVWWDTLGKLCCSCDRGRLMEDAPCVHKLAMAALSESWASTAELPTHKSLGRGARMEMVEADATGSYFAVEATLRWPTTSKELRAQRGACCSAAVKGGSGIARASVTGAQASWIACTSWRLRRL